MNPVLVQAIGIAAMAINLIAFQTKTPRAILLLQLCSASLFTAHYFLLGAYVGCLLNIVGVARAAIYAQIGRRKFAASPVWVFVLIAACVGVYALSFTVFGKEWTVRNALVELFPVVGMAIQTVGMRARGAQRVRVATGVSMPFWSAYNLISRSVGGFLSDLATFTSVVVGYLRYRKAFSKNDPAKAEAQSDGQQAAKQERQKKPIHN